MVTPVKISARLIRRGEELFNRRKTKIEFTGSPDADRLINDLAGHPHAFVLACLMDRQVKAERAWMVPYEISNRLGSFDFSDLEALSEKRWKKLMQKPSSLHRFPRRMGSEAYHAVQRIAEKFDGDASLIWSKKPSSATVVSHFLGFKGIGPKVATMATNILARDFKVPMSDYYSIDISVDVHVRRVFERLGLVDPKATYEQITFMGRSMHPEFPGILDFPAWEIGREWCKPRSRVCGNCYMNKLCPSKR